MSNQFLCVNFKRFANLMAELGNVDDVIMYSALAYQCSKKQPEHSGGVTRTRTQLAKYVSCEEKKVDKVLNRLSAAGYVNSKIGMSVGEKKHTISVKPGSPAVHFGKLSELTQYTKSNKLSVLMAYIFYAKDESGWCKLGRNKTQKLFGLSDRRARELLKSAQDSEFFETSLSGRYHNRQIEIKIEDSFSHIICTDCSDFSPADLVVSPADKGGCPADLVVSPADKGVSPLVYNNRITISKINSKGEVEMNNATSEQSLDSIVICLSDDDKKYLMGALKNTFDKIDCEYVNKDSVTEQILFSLTRRSSQIGTQSFKHAVNMRMKMLRDGTWRAPHGYFKYNEQGKKERAHIDHEEGANDRHREAKRAREEANDDEVVGKVREGGEMAAEVVSNVLSMMEARMKVVNS